MNDIQKIYIDERLMRGEQIPVTIQADILDYIYVYEDGSHSKRLAAQSIGKQGILRQNLIDPINLYNVSVVGASATFKELIPYRREEGWVLVEETFNQDTVLTITSLDAVTLGNTLYEN